MALALDALADFGFLAAGAESPADASLRFDDLAGAFLLDDCATPALSTSLVVIEENKRGALTGFLAAVKVLGASSLASVSVYSCCD